MQASSIIGGTSYAIKLPISNPPDAQAPPVPHTHLPPHVTQFQTTESLPLLPGPLPILTCIHPVPPPDHFLTPPPPPGVPPNHGRVGVHTGPATWGGGGAAGHVCHPCGRCGHAQRAPVRQATLHPLPFLPYLSYSTLPVLLVLPFFLFVTLVTEPRRSLGLKLSDTSLRALNTSPPRLPQHPDSRLLQEIACSTLPVLPYLGCLGSRLFYSTCSTLPGLGGLTARSASRRAYIYIYIYIYTYIMYIYLYIYICMYIYV